MQKCLLKLERPLNDLAGVWYDE
jgi:uncharacterized protein